MNNLIDLVDKFSEDIVTSIVKSLEDGGKLTDIKTTDEEVKDVKEWYKKGSYIYFLYNKNNEVIYIGETGKTIRNRLYADGSGSHNKKNWFKEVESMKYYKNDDMDFNSRKLIERALILKFEPKYNDGKLNKNNEVDAIQKEIKIGSHIRTNKEYEKKVYKRLCEEKILDGIVLYIDKDDVVICELIESSCDFSHKNNYHRDEWEVGTIREMSLSWLELKED